MGHQPCVVLAAIIASGLGSAALGQLSILSVNEQTRAHTWTVAGAPMPPGVDGGTFTGSNTVVGSWNSDLISAPNANNSRATQSSSVSSTSITSFGSVGTGWGGVPSMTDVHYDSLSHFEVRFEVRAAVAVVFHGEVNPELTYSTYVALQRISGPTLAQANYYMGNLTTSYDGVLTPGTYRVYADCPYADATRAGHSWTSSFSVSLTANSPCGSADFDGDGDVGTDADIEAFFACLAGNCCATCGSADFNGDEDTGTDADIEAFFQVLAGSVC